MSLSFPSNQPGKVCITLFFIRLAWQGVCHSLFPLACMAKSVRASRFFFSPAWQGVYHSLFHLACMARSVSLTFPSSLHGKECSARFFLLPAWQGVYHSLFHLASMARSVSLSFSSGLHGKECVTLFFILLARKGVCHSLRFYKECTCHPLFYLACIARSVPLALYVYICILHSKE